MFKKVLLISTLTLLFVGFYSGLNKSEIPVVHAVSYGSACIQAPANCGATGKQLDVSNITDYTDFLNKSWCEFLNNKGVIQGMLGQCGSVGNNFFNCIQVTQAADLLSIDISDNPNIDSSTFWNNKIKPLLLCQSNNITGVYFRHSRYTDFPDYLSKRGQYVNTGVALGAAAPNLHLSIESYDTTNSFFCDSTKNNNEGYAYVQVSNARGCCPSAMPYPTLSTSTVSEIANEESLYCCPKPGATQIIEDTQNPGRAGCANSSGQIIGDGVLAWSGDRVGSYFSANDKASTPGNTPAVYLPGNRIGSDKVCDPKSSSTCALVAQDSSKGLSLAAPEKVTGLDGSLVVKANALDSLSLTCKQCYENGDVIYTDTKSQTLSTCNNGSVKETALVAGSSSITAGYLISDPANKEAYLACFNSGGIWTAIGCVDPTPIGILTGIIRIAFGVMGGVALLQVIYAGIMYQMGNEEKIKEARKMITATILGLVVLVFSIVILRVIGINVLDILPSGSV